MIIPDIALLARALGVTASIPTGFALPSVFDNDDFEMLDFPLFNQQNDKDLSNATVSTYSLIRKYCMSGKNPTNTSVSDGNHVAGLNVMDCLRIFGPSIRTDTGYTMNSKYILYARQTGSEDARWYKQTVCTGYSLTELYTSRSSSVSDATQKTDILSWKLLDAASVDISAAAHKFLPFSNYQADTRKYFKDGSVLTTLDNVQLVVNVGTTAGTMTTGTHHCLIQVEKRDRSDGSWTKLMPDPIAESYMGLKEGASYYNCVKKDTTNGNDWNNKLGVAVPISNMYNIGLNLMDYMKAGYRFRLWQRSTDDHLWVSYDPIEFKEVSAAGSTAMSVSSNTAQHAGNNASKNTIISTGAVEARLVANFLTQGVTFCFVPTGDDFFHKKRRTVCHAQTDFPVSNNYVTDGFPIPGDSNVHAWPAADTNNGLGAAIAHTANPAAQHFYPGKYEVWSRVGAKKAYKEKSDYTIKWKTASNPVTVTTYGGICLKECVHTNSNNYGSEKTSALISDIGASASDQYTDWGNGKTSIVIDTKTFTAYYALWIYLKEPMNVKISGEWNPYWIYWSTRVDCDCSQGYCDKNATADANKFEPKVIVGTVAGQLDYYGDAGCQYKYYGKKFYFTQNAKYYMCVQANKTEMGTVVKRNTTETVSVTINAVAPAAPATGTAAIAAPSSLAKISGLATFAPALITAFLM